MINSYLKNEIILIYLFVGIFTNDKKNMHVKYYNDCGSLRTVIIKTHVIIWSRDTYIKEKIVHLKMQFDWMKYLIRLF